MHSSAPASGSNDCSPISGLTVRVSLQDDTGDERESLLRHGSSEQTDAGAKRSAGDGMHAYQGQEVDLSGQAVTELQILGDLKVGCTLIAAGKMPPGLTKCKYVYKEWLLMSQFVKSRQPTMISSAKIKGAAAPFYQVTTADIGHRLRVWSTPVKDGSRGEPSSAITRTVVPPVVTVEGRTISDCPCSPALCITNHETQADAIPT
eukprot:scaffold946_cov415-Prasinococcus_capsulatus_cf.AAC.4